MEFLRGGYLKPKMGMVLACYQGMGPVTGSFRLVLDGSPSFKLSTA